MSRRQFESLFASATLGLALVTSIPVISLSIKMKLEKMANEKYWRKEDNCKRETLMNLMRNSGEIKYYPYIAEKNIYVTEVWDFPTTDGVPKEKRAWEVYHPDRERGQRGEIYLAKLNNLDYLSEVTDLTFYPLSKKHECKKTFEILRQRFPNPETYLQERKKLAE